MILHLRVVPGFWLAVEACSRPELLTHPAVIGGLPHQRGTVQEVNVPAQSRGVRPGMTLAQAHQQCPDAIFLTPDLPRYDALWAKICAILQCSTPLVESVEMGQAVCDLSGCERRWSDPWQAAAEIAAQVHAGSGIAPWLGIAANRLVAQFASAQAGATGIAVVEAGREEAFLADLPLALLPGVDARLALTFQVLGLRTMKQLAALPRSTVKGRFGVAGERLHDYARGIDPRPVVPPPSRPAISFRRECEDGTIEEALAILHHLAESCAAELTHRSLAAMLVSLTLVWREPSPPRSLSHFPRGRDHAGDGTPRPPTEESERAGLQEIERGGGGTPGDPGSAFPIPYRIHSMLPQPGNQKPNALPPITSHEPCSLPVPAGGVSYEPEPAAQRAVESSALRPVLQRTAQNPGPGRNHRPEKPHNSRVIPRHSLPSLVTARAIVRTPISTAPPLFERTRALFLQLWPQDALSDAGPSSSPLRAIELEVTEFAQPIQLSFAELNRLDCGGRFLPGPGLAGMDPIRLQTLLQSEQALAARYGDASFRHLTSVDPASILTERRFRWANGLPWEPTRTRPRRKS